MAHLPLKMRHQRIGFLQSGQQTIADYVAGALSTASPYRYVYASYIDEPVMRWQTSNSARVYYHRNQQYSVTALTSNTGAVLERYAYTAYGVPTITTATGVLRSVSAHANRYLYTGREWDPTIFQYHYGARMYDANLGRFCSRDPIGFEAGSSCLYEYCHSGPTKYIDPWGKQIIPIHPMDPSVHTPGLPDTRPTPPHVGICERMAVSGTCGGCTLAGCETDLEDLIEAIDRVPWTVSWGWETCERWVLAYPYLNGELLPSRCFEVEVQQWNIPWPQGFPFTGHAAVKIIACNGEVFYIDNWWLGGDDHIFGPGEIPDFYF